MKEIKGVINKLITALQILNMHINDEEVETLAQEAKSKLDKITQ